VPTPQAGAFAGKGGAQFLGDALDLSRSATVAEVVPLDFNNRVLVAQGLMAHPRGRMQEGCARLVRVCRSRSFARERFDLGFLLGPRLNAAGRLSDMSWDSVLIPIDRGRALETARQARRPQPQRRQPSKPNAGAGR